MLKIDKVIPGEVGLARLEPSDAEALRRFFFRLSPVTIQRRFLAPLTRPEQTSPDRLLDLDHRDREAVIAVLDGEIVGVARYAREGGEGPAEVAVVVADRWQGQGIGSQMVTCLVEIAAKVGIPAFTMTIQADNRAALSLMTRFRRVGPMSVSYGVYEATIAITNPDPVAA